MKRILLFVAFSFCFPAVAQLDSTANRDGVMVLGSMSRGGFALGAAYEHLFENSTGLVGHFRMFQKDDDKGANGYMIFGGGLSHHFYKKKWDLAFTPSFNVISIDSVTTTPGDSTTMGPGLSIALLWTLTPKFSLGFDYNTYWVWFDEDYVGNVINDFAIKFKVAF